MKKGVTLIELMVAIVILGIIAGAVADKFFIN
jgi:prepilin-type N-terminal cleavage/methylation domain-containing protein